MRLEILRNLLDLVPGLCGPGLHVGHDGPYQGYHLFQFLYRQLKYRLHEIPL